MALHQGQYLEYQPAPGLFRVLTRQPAGRFVEAAEALQQAASGSVVTAAFDPSRGSILALQVQTPDQWERLHQGGTVGYIILVLALLGITIALVRMVQLRLVLYRVERQLRQVLPPAATIRWAGCCWRWRVARAAATGWSIVWMRPFCVSCLLCNGVFH